MAKIISPVLHPNQQAWLDMVNSDLLDCNIYPLGTPRADTCNATEHSLYDTSGKRLFGITRDYFDRANLRALDGECVAARRVVNQEIAMTTLNSVACTNGRRALCSRMCVPGGYLETWMMRLRKITYRS